MNTTNAERRQDMSSSPIQRQSQQSQQQASSAKSSTPVDKENVVYDGRSQRYLKNQSPQKIMNGPLSYKTQPSIQSSFQQPRMRPSVRPSTNNGVLFPPTTTMNHQAALNHFPMTADTAANDESSSFMQDESFGPIHSNLQQQMDVKRRRYNSDPVASFLHRQFDQENVAAHAAETNQVLPLQAWTSNWRDVNGSNTSATLMRPKPIRPTAILP